jgi:predicted Zn-dependent protease
MDAGDRRVRILLLFSFLAAVTVSAQDRDQEFALGTRLADEIRLQSHPLESFVVRAYANGICQKLAAKLPDPGIPYSLDLISGGGNWALSQEPLVLPGGYVFVRADQILGAPSEAEFVGMLAHAMAHVAGSHFTRRESGQIAWPTAAQDRARFEFEADLLAIRAVRDAGYDPAGLIRYLNRLQRAPGTDSSVFAPPPRAVRVAALESTIRGFPAQTYESPDPEEFARIQAEVRQAVPPVSPPKRPYLQGPHAESLRKHN